MFINSEGFSPSLFSFSILTSSRDALRKYVSLFLCLKMCSLLMIAKDLKFGVLFGEFRHFYIKMIIYISKIKKSLKTQIK